MSPGNVWALRTRMAFVPQEPDLGEGTVREALERPFAYQVNRDRRPEPGRIRVLLNDFRLDAGMLDQALSELSGGEKQRVALITALLLDRALYLLDEVTSALDDLTRDAVCRYFSDHREFALIAVTHDRGFMSCCGRRLKLERGRLWEDGRG